MMKVKKLLRGSLIRDYTNSSNRRMKILVVKSSLKVNTRWLHSLVWLTVL